MVRSSGKLLLLDRMLIKFRGRGNKVVVIAQDQAVLAMLSRYGARVRQKVTPDDAIGSHAVRLKRTCVRPMASFSGTHSSYRLTL
jgi:hypothetical protein